MKKILIIAFIFAAVSCTKVDHPETHVGIEDLVEDTSWPNFSR